MLIRSPPKLLLALSVLLTPAIPARSATPVQRVDSLVNEASGRLSGATTAESQPGVLPFW